MSASSNVRLGGLLAGLALVLLAGGCFNPEYGDVAFRCDPGEGASACPDGYECRSLREEGNFICQTGEGGVEPGQEPQIVRFDVKNSPIRFGSRLRYEIETRNHELIDPKVAGPATSGEGHYHLWFNDDVNGYIVRFENLGLVDVPELPEGTHTITAQLVGNQHAPIEPRVEVTREFVLAR